MKFKMKNSLIALALVAGVSTSATASEIDFMGSQYGGFDVTFDLIDFLAETATVTQTDSNNDGTIVGPDFFDEFGSTSVVALTLNNASQFYSNTTFDGSPLESDMVLYFDYNVQGTATQSGPNDTDVNFTALPSAELYLYWDQFGVDGNLDGFGGTNDRETKVSLATFTLNGGSCLLDTVVDAGTGDVSINGPSSCEISMTGNFTAGNFFTSWGADLSTLTNPIGIDYAATVQNLNGLNFNYAAAGGQQVFNVDHDGNMAINVPEPTTLAILGLGLLGFAGTRRRS
ncbi:PEP-CTERM protein-sorting domain-containing protein [Colwellia chukchiensis]|uniref:PEP-CTERM protein-sorting domain-containing protein n=2 Tax=Colwellia chukchiensis TaxID=641665 RepID=A0A1H7T6H3_9GAMM|nr:PEP-CTERM protein-sorting domain-containing protein [Colwellia chukchiensis]